MGCCAPLDKRGLVINSIIRKLLRLESIKLLTLRLEKVNLAPDTFYLRRDLTAVVFGLTIYLTLFVCHGYLFGVGLAAQ